jgi:hypothetical protein
MKTHGGFISNSSSTNFIIMNLTDKPKNLVDFVTENPQLVQMYNREYVHSEVAPVTLDELLKSAAENNKILSPGDNYCTFGDEQGTLIGRMFDYILRDGGSSKSFSWEFESYSR